jgi:hypothetical protein
MEGRESKRKMRNESTMCRRDREPRKIARGYGNSIKDVRVPGKLRRSQLSFVRN